MRSGRGCYETNTLRPLSFVPVGALWSGGRDKDNILYWKLALCVSMWACVVFFLLFFFVCFVLLWGVVVVGGSRGVLITASYQVTCKCVIGPNFLMCISAPRSGRECWQGKRLCHCFSVNTQWVNFSRENALIALLSWFVFFLTFYQTWKTFFSVQTFWNCIKAHASLSTFPLKKNKSIELEWSGLKGEWVLVLLHRALPLFSWSWTHRVLIPSISH